LSLETDKEIVVNRVHPPVRRALTIAHEIGHLVLHASALAKNPDIGVLYRRSLVGEKDLIEQEGNCFAANLLVLEFMLAKLYRYDLSLRNASSLFFWLVRRRDEIPTYSHGSNVIDNHGHV